MRASLLVVVFLAACASRGPSDHVAPDSGPADLGLDDGHILDGPPLPPDLGDLGPADSGHDSGSESGPGSGSDSGLDSGTVSDSGLDSGSDAGRAADSGSDSGALPDSGSGPVFVLGAPMADCNTTCGAIGRGCGGSASVGLDCMQHMDIATCDDPANWIFRASPTKPPPYCRPDWGTSDVCSNNYNVYNQFCCRCL